MNSPITGEEAPVYELSGFRSHAGLESDRKALRLACDWTLRSWPQTVRPLSQQVPIFGSVPKRVFTKKHSDSANIAVASNKRVGIAASIPFEAGYEEIRKAMYEVVHKAMERSRANICWLKV
jgi:hypothetical protein